MGFPLLAEAAHGFAETHGERGNGFDALLAAIGQAAVVFAANLGEQELGVAKDSSERVVQLVTQHLAEILTSRRQCRLRLMAEA